eukprot:TRINITY_DN10004_c0_g1_i8.p1 TRINITY_DN10004_c0_g1~~TRINITY_DN10004_c0_g1_i8.p1  ORF type:complete len:218 (+),score=45.99 TRINITY_DN10004_c0_g1_i8:220-873(+)
MNSLLYEADVEVAQCLADNYHVLFTDFKEFDNKNVMYKQKFFTLNFSVLLNDYKKPTGANRESIYVVAISNLLMGLPTTIFTLELSKLLPVLFNALRIPLNDCEHPLSSSGLHTTTVETLIMLFQEVPVVMCEHLHSIIPILLQLSRLKGVSYKLRMASLKCLQVITLLPFLSIQRFKAQVVRELKPALNDHKRCVRRVAVKARNDWFTTNFVPQAR